MKKGLKKAIAIAGAVAMLGGTAGTLSACGDGTEPIKDGYNTFTSVMPSNWNMLTYEDANDTQIMSYIASPFFEFDYQWDASKGGKFTADGKVNAAAIVPGAYSIQTSAATAIEDVTNKTFPGTEETYAAHYGIYDGSEIATEEYCYKITLRQDLKWDDGTAIDSSDFLYSMKEQLDPKFQNYRANSYYDNTPIMGAKEYVYQGQKSWYGALTPYEEEDYTEDMNDKLVFTLGSPEENKEKGSGTSWMRDYFVQKGYIAKDADIDKVGAFLEKNGLVESVDALKKIEGKTATEIAASDELTEIFDGITTGFFGVGLDVAPELFMYLCIVEYEWPEYSFDKVGFTTPSQYEIVVCFSNPQTFFKEDGSYSYNVAYTMAELPLVKKDLYEKCKKAPAEGAKLWTSNYNSSLETTASWGPYKLTSFQSGKSYTLEKNENWYGYKMDQYKDQYLIDKINCEQIEEIATQWMAFLSGRVDDVGIDVSHAEDYRNSKYAQYTPGTGCFSLNLYGGEKLATNERNNGILGVTEFRKAVSLAIDRDDYNAKTTTAHQSLYGNLNSMYYYDVDNGLRYRDTAIAKATLLRAYGYVESADGKWTLESNAAIKDLDLEAAYKTLKGYDITLARKLVDEAYDIVKADKEKYHCDPDQPIKLIYGTSVDNDNTRRDYNYIVGVFENLFKGTKLEGKVTIEFNSSYGKDWNKEFKAGSYEIASGTGWQGAAFDPCYMISAYLDPASAYSKWWDTETETMTWTMPEGEYDEAGEEFTMSIMNWYRCLNGTASSDNGDFYLFNWSEGKIPTDARLALLAQLEYLSLTQYYSIPTTTQISAGLLGAKFSNLSNEYNTFMGFGGFQYLRVNYDFEGWKQFVADNKNDLSAEYKKSE